MLRTNHQQQQQQQQLSSSSSSDSQLFKQLETATQIVDDRLNSNLKLNQPIQLESTLQGHSSSEYSLPPNLIWAPLIKRRTIHLPDVLFDQYDIQQHRCLMGIFPQIQRAWFTVDNRLFLWDYRDGNDFASFEQLEEIISAIAIAKPKPGLFVADIQHLLVISTPLTVTIVGLALKPNPSATSNLELSLYMTGLEVPTDGIVFTSIFSHQSTGRIFLIGSTDSQAGQTVGNELFEFEYRSEEGWFKKRCLLVNHSKGGAGAGALSSLLPSWLKSVTQGNILMMNVDQERNLIYLLLKSGSITILSLGRTGLDTPTEVASASNIVREALAMCPAAGPLLDPRTFEITGIHIITKQEGGHVGLVAVTSQGVRMYFSLAKRPYGYGYSANSSTLPLSSDPDAIPSSLWLCHVRLPPRNSTPSTNQSKENQLSAITLSSGFQLMGDHQNGGMQDAEEAELEIPLIPNPLNLSYSHYTSPGGFWVSSHSVDSEHNVLLAVAPDVAHLLQASSTSAATATTATQAAATTTSTGFLQTSNPSLSAQQQQQQQPFQSSISEIACPIKIEGHAWAITHTTQDSDLDNYHPIQLVGPQQEWLVLSNMGITVLSSQRPVDTLAELLNNMPGKEQELSLFWDRFGRDQTCAMSLSIAVGESTTYNHSSESNSKYHSLLQPSLGAPGGYHHRWGPETIQQAKKLLVESSGRPEISLSGGNSQGYSNSFGLGDGKKICFSGKHEGIALYMAWLVRPIWKKKVLVLSGVNPSLPVSNLSEALLTKVQKDLEALRHFIDNEVVLLASIPDVRTAGRTDPAVYNLEQASIVGLRVLLTQAVEALSFIQLLIDYKLGDLLTASPREVSEALLNLTYREFITGQQGRDCARELVKTLINQQISQSFSVDAISETLQQRCGTFCTSDDVLLYKAIEALSTAKESSSSQEKRNWAREALRLFQKGSKHMSLEVLQDACHQFTEAGFLDGVVELSLTCAKVWDPTRQALSYWKEGQPKGDSRSKVYEVLDQCYLTIKNALVNFDPIASTSSGLTAAELSSVLDHAVQLALTSDDELFHYRYYDWLLEQDKTMPLLEARTPFLEAFLQAPPITLSKADLLWQYYTRNSAFCEAARILANLASDDGLNLQLPRRIEYLSLAVSNAKSTPNLITKSENGEVFSFLTDIEEKLEVAQVQVEVLQNVLDLSDDQFQLNHHHHQDQNAGQTKEVILQVLQSRLLTISEIYRDIVEPLGLLECTLLIFHVSDHRDLNLIQTVWSAIIEQAHEGRPGGLSGVEGVANKVSQLGRKFYPSDIAFNTSMIVGILEKYAFDNPLPGDKKWVGSVLREAGLPWQTIWESIDELFTSKLPPWHIDSTLSFLTFEIAEVIKEWIQEMDELNDFLLTTSHSNSNPNSTGTANNGFPAARLEDVIDRYIDTLSHMLINSHPSSLRTGANPQTQSNDEFSQAIHSLKTSKLKIRDLF
ncbi:uncharacterized protein PGTG_15085 [Puccinia graminis f. sp. tritici CRL 75-36-700-3]|uniref:Nucleoporin Nup133/Nup155-like N-terminal domain-containing protein n=1 Tax=Puccinia graminis f. sp. tritici (strain CRL 75-36-700-3 / race SCCL) TaxID=418459 RepID=E3KY43_PUCGT|nr:uncharacterized protein PGTG_15085 [Puccinia graminis f. sp. tritici CRL 75-36-700-3]EFP89244.1 hypothetical protein PGTG_15085 [Puccinia graminis f. sp. tritici CRL 75-36-700-3]